ncbi:hypothetical protein CTAYLR_004000 [Chrysophaeum taylorii]|uniref:Peptidase M1 leukotriene A4 hydrolase/aminopeptidase C-terminal domain-containing protein n=1 Tax=Chrysophaeum taylorii TaxID=2483200 RepID=A0AAD7U803_9STRA|nr:hypothetical protein CTAYLR_004000 [Chrysophaeum taylorii]
MASSRREAATQSNYEEAWATHAALEWTIDFEKQQIRGRVRYVVESSGVGVSEFVVDTNGGLRIHRALVNGRVVSPKLGVPHPIFGTAVAVPVGSEVVFEYETGTACAAAQWLEPEQTADGKFPYLFTQCQAIHCRSLIPIQDVPGVKLTWEARVEKPAWATVLMSGLEEKETDSWRQPRRVSPYLIAIVCARVEARDVSPRCRVWAEPSVVERAASEFADAETYVERAEEATGVAYQWDRYDLVCLPPSFPYGGMENVNLTFVTPTLLAGDKSLANVVAHEVAHSWFGNLVTNATWAHFWLNEGWTRWLERQISGVPVDFDISRSRAALTECVEHFPRPELTALVPPLRGVDPDDAFSIVPYEKGSGLLHYIEHLVGKDRFREFVRSYLGRFEDGVVTSEDFKNFAVENLLGSSSEDIDWDAWFHAPGNLPQTYALDTSLTVAVDEAAAAFPWVPACSYFSWPTALKLAYLERLLLLEKCEKDDLQALDAALGLTATPNAEIRFRWCRLLLSSGVDRGVDLALDFVTSNGRMKFVRPLYKALAAAPIPGALAAAKKTFKDHYAFYHPICRKMITSDLLRGGYNLAL